MKRLTRIYLEAARKIAEGEEDFACCAIDATVNSRAYGMPLIYSDARGAFERLIGPESGETPFTAAWLCEPYASDEFDQHRRVVALCLAAAMAETGDLS